MKKLIIFSLFTFNFSFLTYSTGQNKHVDSLKSVLAHTSSSLKRFSLINLIEEDYFNTGSGGFDSSYVMQLLNIAVQLNNDSLKAISYDWIGTYYSIGVADYPKALDFLLKAVPLAEKANDKMRLCSIYFDISNLYNNLNNPTEVLNYARKGGEVLPEKTSHSYSFMMVQYCAAMAAYYSMVQKPDSELHYLQAWNEINISLGRAYSVLEALEGLGDFYRRQKNYTLSNSYFKNSIQIADSTNDYYDLCNYRNIYGASLLKQNQLQEAKAQAMLSYNRSRQFRNNDLMGKAAGLLQQIFDTLHNTDSAYYFSRAELAMRDSVFNQDNLNKIQSMAFSEKLRTMDEEAKIAEERAKQKENIQYILLAFCILTFIILFLILSRSIITNPKIIEVLGVIALLIVFEFLNLILGPYVDKITHHTPWLMLIGSVCIAALLSPIHHRIEQWATHKLVEKNKEIRLAAAKKTIEKLGKDKPNT
ncbi:MAG TPA: tetratricopeptide repeat protein [Bacteroidia bacterium]|jgi:tetratricopeptide (TPR) repeat protein|nr:tetratricopeptide repeat protein [Bacteroidia bacterium]